jgi:hypothetical protein
MLKAQQLYPPRDPNEMYFRAPAGVEFVRIDSQSHLPATPYCPDTYDEAFLVGAVPSNQCPLHSPPPISQILGDTVGEVVTEAGKGANSALRSVGRIIGGIFGK